MHAVSDNEITSNNAAAPETNPEPVSAEPQPPTEAQQWGHVNIFFRLAAGLVALFVITIFGLIAILFGDPAAPVARLLDRIGLQLIVGELFAILVVGTFAMTFDRRSPTPQANTERKS